MIVLIDKTFEKDVDKIDSKSILSKIADSIINAQRALHLEEISGLKKLSGYKKEYRIRIGDYRLGLIIEGNTIEFVRCLNRKDIYKYFP